MHNPNFSSGPCSKRPAWGLDALKDAAVGRSHRSNLGKEKLAKAIAETKRILGIPGDYLCGIMPGSDTGAFEAAMWSLLGPAPVTVLVWESFSEGWATDIAKQLKLDPTILKADYGRIPDLSAIDWTNDVVFVANGTTSGVKTPDWDWIPAAAGTGGAAAAKDADASRGAEGGQAASAAGKVRLGLTLCDATSAAFAMAIDWTKIDALTFSWQKCLGGEAAHGMLVLSPRAVARLESYDPPWPLPKIFRMKKGGKVDAGIFAGDTINTPSMLCVEDYLDALAWADEMGGLQGLIARSEANLKIVEDWTARNPWLKLLAEDKRLRSNTSVCLAVADPELAALPRAEQERVLKGLASDLAKRKIAFDINPYRDAPPGYRFWCGPTVEGADLERALAELEAAWKMKKGSGL
ncbi:MAG: phosphoserine transaminase [Pseudomonadota bacterium]|nr:phosphoserine transaminase [Pseudomonadota bacterium]